MDLQTDKEEDNIGDEAGDAGMNNQLSGVDVS